MSSPITFPGLGITIDPSPVAFTIGSKEIYWYGVIIAAGFLLAYVLMQRKAPRFGLTGDDVLDMLLWAVPIGVIGARIYYCAFYWELFRDDPISCLYIWEGGLAIYGGVIAGVLGLCLYSRVKKKPLPVVLDVASLGVIVGQICGRWGNFFNREAHGSETTSFLRMGLTGSDGVVRYYHPTFLYESVWNLVGLLLMHFLSKKRKFDGEVFFLYIAWYGLGRLFIEGLRTDSLYLFGSNLRVSQLVALLSIIGGLGAVAFIRINKHPEPEDLLVNSLKKAAEKPVEEAEESGDEELYDEDFASALELLRKRSTVAADDASDSDDAIEEPVDASPSSDEDDLSDRKANE